MLYIFDLDHTVIDSSHRQNTLPDGSLDLAHWIDNNTSEKIHADSLLPLANTMRHVYKAGYTVAIITARVLSVADYEFLEMNDLHYDFIYSRPIDCRDSDHVLKLDCLLQLCIDANISRARMALTARFYDDNKGVLKMAAAEFGISTVFAPRENDRLRLQLPA